MADSFADNDGDEGAGLGSSESSIALMSKCVSSKPLPPHPHEVKQHDSMITGSVISNTVAPIILGDLMLIPTI